jgi:hypothetical protein
MHRRHHLALRALAAAACAAALGACSSSTGTKPSGATPPPKDVQAAVAASIAANVTSQITAMTTTGDGAFLAFFNRISNKKPPAVNLSQTTKRRSHSLAFGPDCPAITPATLVDTDGDGIPDSLAETWGADCSDTSGGSIVSITGSISIDDATPTVADLAYNANISNFSIQESDTSVALSLAINGTLGVTETLSSISEAANYQFSLNETVPQSVSESVNENLTANYSFPATGTLLVEGDQLPAGTFSLTGSETFGINSANYAFTVATPTPLSVDEVACATGVTAGVLTVTFTGSSGSGTATITWTACGVYTITDA